MRSILFYLPAIALLFASFISCGQKEKPKSMEVTYLGNEGFLINTGKTKILIDGLFRSKYYVSPPDSVLNKMMGSGLPFDSIEFMFVTHPHHDHFSDSLTCAFLQAHPETRFISSTETCDSMKHKTEKIQKQMTCIEPDTDRINYLSYGVTKITSLWLKHTGNQPVVNLAYIVQADGFTFCHVGDALLLMNEETLDKVPWDSLKIDVLFLTYFDKESPSLRYIKEKIKPKHIVLMHATKDNMQTAREIALEYFDNALVLEKPMNTVVLTK